MEIFQHHPSEATIWYNSRRTKLIEMGFKLEKTNPSVAFQTEIFHNPSIAFGVEDPKTANVWCGENPNNHEREIWIR